MTSVMRSGMPAISLPEVEWRKSSRSGAIGNCVEIAWLPGELVALRNSRDRQGPALIYPQVDLATFLTEAKKR